MSPSSDSPDKQYQQLTEEEFRRLFDSLFPSIRNFLYYKLGDSDLAEDLAQDAFVKVWENKSRIDLRTIKSYIYTIAGNLAINYVKRQQLQYRFISESGAQGRTESPEDIVVMNEYRDKLLSVIAAMPEGSREVFLMNRIEDLKYREIAERLSISVKAVEKRMSKALKIIRDKLGVEL